MKQSWLLFIVASVTLLSCKKDFSSSGVSEDEKSIRSTRQLSNQAIALHDTASIARSWTTDFHLLTSRNAEVSGRKNAAQKFADEFKARPDIIYVRTPETVQVFETWHMASEQGHWTGRWKDKDETIEVGGTYFAKWHKLGNKWLIRAEVFVPLRCEGGKFCDQSPL